MSNSDPVEDFFSSEIMGVRPLNQDKVFLKPTAGVPLTEAQKAAREAALRVNRADENYLTEEYVEMLNPHDILSFQRPGIQDGVFRKLRMGQYTLDATIDLHRMTMREARSEVFKFLKEAGRLELRTVMILHGKGERGNPPALLKSYVARWLTQVPEVMAFHSAAKQHGGAGAVYVLLRKGERRKQENRERHLNRRG
jgi:DNA-nicking Smr family endonuclease